MTSQSSQPDIAQWYQNALQIEAQAIINHSHQPPDFLPELCELLIHSQGKLVVTGIGKSGHIARKLASTFASTGTSSFYLHPSEALHGDLGMIGPQDQLLAIAYSGETFEVLQVCQFAQRLGVPIIAITGHANSSLGRMAQYVFEAHTQQEACPLNLAPTASSTLSLAIGDALAVCLMHARGFTEENFSIYHPAGSLGRKLVLVKDLMRDLSQLQLVHVQDSFKTVLNKISHPNFGIIAVVNDKQELVGSITDGDLRRALIQYHDKALSKQASEIMTPNPKRIASNKFALEAVKIMESKITALFVHEPEQPQKLVGLLRMHDLLQNKII